jgi:hypothetical protein
MRRREDHKKGMPGAQALANLWPVRTAIRGNRGIRRHIRTGSRREKELKQASLEKSRVCITCVKTAFLAFFEF